mgnify:CR=1 FL=1
MAPGHNASGRAPDDVIGLTLGNCVIHSLLGQGGMARVYRAKQANLDRDVAIKILPPYYAADPAFVERFKLEARALARLSHPHIVIVHDAGEDQGRLYIVMEYVAGGNLRQYMAQSMPLREVVRIIKEVADALAYAHAHGIIHRDVKPVNVLLDENKRAVLSDFGIAKVMETSAAFTRGGAGVGTPEYMSPEQCRGGAIDTRTDIYALGVMLYEMLTGHTPFEADNYTALAHSHIYEAPPPPSRLNPRISPAVQAVVLKALEKDPANRFQTATEMAQAFEAAAAAQTPVHPSANRLSQGPARRAPLTGPIAASPTVGQPTVICPRCHAQNSAQQRFCSTCGLPFGQAQPSLPQVAPAPAQPVPYQPGQPGPVSGAFVACPACHALNQPLNRYCTRCGYNLLQGVSGRICRACGARNGAAIRFCTTCGNPLSP